MKTYLLAGASSAMAIETALLLKGKKHSVIGISTKPQAFNYDSFFQIEKYDFGGFPVLETPIDGIVYFPGTINLKPFHRYTANDFLNDLSINTLGAAAFTQAYLPNLKKTESASVVLVSSVAASTGMPFHASISAAKGALESLGRSLAAEFAPHIRVNCVAPSLVNSPLSERLLNTPEKTEQMEKRNPMKKIGNPNHVAEAIEFLLSEKSAWITGQSLAVDGGMANIKNS
jgi:3-oxoacyl-[acyl-carrier protein] reductase